MNHSISIPMFTYKPRVLSEDGFSLRVVYQLNYVFRIKIRTFTSKPRGILSGTYVHGCIVCLSLMSMGVAGCFQRVFKQGRGSRGPPRTSGRGRPPKPERGLKNRAK